MVVARTHLRNLPPPIEPLLRGNPEDEPKKNHCTQVAPWSAHYERKWFIHLYADNPSESLHSIERDYEQMNIEKTINFLKVATDGKYTEKDLTKQYAEGWVPKDIFDTSDLAYYYSESSINITRQCTPQFCKALKFPGDSDVLGQGTMYSYYLLAFLSTLYFAGLLLFPALLAAAAHVRKSATVSKWQERLQLAAIPFRNTINNVFLDTALIFVNAMLLATIVRWYSSEHRKNYDLEASHVNFRIGFCCSLFCAHTPLILLLVSNYDKNTQGRQREQEEKRINRFQGHRTRRALLVAALVLIATACGLVVYWEVKTSSNYLVMDNHFNNNIKGEFDGKTLEDLATEIIWSQYCEKEANYLRLTMFVNASICCVYFLGYLAYLLVHAYRWRRRSSRKRAQNGAVQEKDQEELLDPREKKHNTKGGRRGLCLRACKVLGTILLGMVSLGMMWISLLSTHFYRHENDLIISEPLDTWTFGQVLSLSTWASVMVVLLIQAFYVFQLTPKKESSGNHDQNPQHHYGQVQQQPPEETDSQTTLAETPPPLPPRPIAQFQYVPL